MRVAYCFGIPGVVASGSVWLSAGLIALLFTPLAGMITLIAGGMLIFPMSVMLCKAFGCTGQHQKSNPLAPLAIEGTLWMLLSIPIAVAVALSTPEWFFPAMLVIIGGRYLSFHTLYGLRIYWGLGAALALAALLLVLTDVPPFVGGLSGGLLELLLQLSSTTIQENQMSRIRSASEFARRR